MIRTKLTEMLGIEYPIVQGCMQWISRAPLVAVRRAVLDLRREAELPSNVDVSTQDALGRKPMFVRPGSPAGPTARKPRFIRPGRPAGPTARKP